MSRFNFEKILECADCGKKMSRNKEEFVDHLLGHSIVKKCTTCVLCKEVFETMQALTLHVIWHVGLLSFTTEYKNSFRIGNVNEKIEKLFSTHIFGVKKGIRLRKNSSNRFFVTEEPSEVTEEYTATTTVSISISDNEETSELNSHHQSNQQHKVSSLPYQISRGKKRRLAAKRKKLENSDWANLDDLVIVDGPPKNCPLTDCDKPFETSKALLLHLLSSDHNPVKVCPFKCPLCEKKVRSWKNMPRHISTHIGYNKYMCGKCSQLFLECYHFRWHTCEPTTTNSTSN